MLPGVCMSVSWCRLLQDHVTFVVPPSTHKGKEHTIATHGCRIISAHPEDCLLYHQTVLIFFFKMSGFVAGLALSWLLGEAVGVRTVQCLTSQGVSGCSTPSFLMFIHRDPLAERSTWEFYYLSSIRQIRCA